jgi:hypothetical protein
MAWTDERLEERFNGIDQRFDEVNRRLDGVDGQLAELRQGMVALHASLNRGSFAVVASLLGVIAAILIKGG